MAKRILAGISLTVYDMTARSIRSRARRGGAICAVSSGRHYHHVWPSSVEGAIVSATTRRGARRGQGADRLADRPNCARDYRAMGKPARYRPVRAMQAARPR